MSTHQHGHHARRDRARGPLGPLDRGVLGRALRLHALALERSRQRRREDRGRGALPRQCARRRLRRGWRRPLAGRTRLAGRRSRRLAGRPRPGRTPRRRGGRGDRGTTHLDTARPDDLAAAEGDLRPGHGGVHAPPRRRPAGGVRRPGRRRRRRRHLPGGGAQPARHRRGPAAGRPGPLLHRRGARRRPRRPLGDRHQRGTTAAGHAPRRRGRDPARHGAARAARLTR